MSDRREQVIKHQLSKGGWRGRINAKCVECIYDDHPGNGTWRQQVEGCTSTNCPLYDVRPVSSVVIDDET